MNNYKKAITRRLWLSNAKPNNQRDTKLRMLGFALLSPTYITYKKRVTRNEGQGTGKQAAWFSSPLVPRPSSLSMRGFTLIELVVAITLLGIVGSIAAVFLSNTLEGYSALNRRDDLQTSLRMAVERISRELRHALPNSVCTDDGSGCNNPGSIVYFIRTIDAGEYQTRSGNYAGGQARAPLPVTPTSASSFDVLSGNSLNAAVGQWVVVYNTDNTDIYSSGSRRRQINNISSKDTDGVAPDDVSVIQFASAVNFPTHSPSRRFHVIENNAVIFYLQGTDLYRAQSNFGSPATATGGTEKLLLQNVSACTFTYVPGSLLRSGLLRINISVNNGTESLQMIHEAQVYNAP